MLTPAFTFSAIGTTWRITFFQEVIGKDAVIFPEITKRIAEFDARYSRFREDSWIRFVGETKGVHRIPDDGGELFSLYDYCYVTTDGAMTPLLGSLMVGIGYRVSYEKRNTVSQEVVLREKQHIPLWGSDVVYDAQEQTITVHTPCLFDLGAIGKGYLIDEVGALLHSYGITEYCIDAGGDILHGSKKQQVLRVGLENPYDTTTVIGTTAILNESIAGSAGNRRVFATHHHIVNAHTQQSRSDIAAVWVKAPSARIADMLTTVLYMIPPHTVDQYVFDYLILYDDYHTEGTLSFE